MRRSRRREGGTDRSRREGGTDRSRREWGNQHAIFLFFVLIWLGYNSGIHNFGKILYIMGKGEEFVVAAIIRREIQ